MSALRITKYDIEQVIQDKLKSGSVGTYQCVHQALCLKLGGPLMSCERKLITKVLQECKRKQAVREREPLMCKDKSLRFMMLTAYSNDYPVGKLCEGVNRKYAARHGYKFVAHCLPTDVMLDFIKPKAHCTWYKIRLITEMLEKEKSIDYLMWIDADAVVVKPEKPLTDIVAFGEGQELIIGEDMSKSCLLNAGVFLVRNCEYSKKFFHDVWNTKQFDKYYTQPFYEQSALIWLLNKRQEGISGVKPFHFYMGGPTVKQFPHVCVLAKHLLNSNVYLQNEEDRDLPAQFVFHPAGAKNKRDVILCALEHYGLTLH